MAGYCRGSFLIVFLLLAAFEARAQRLTTSADFGETASERFDAGREAFERADYALAVTEFLAAIEAGSEGPSARYNLGVSYYRLGDYEAADSVFRDLAERFPAMRSLAAYNVGLSLVRRNRSDLARDWFLRAADTDDERIATLSREMLARLPDRTRAPASDWLMYADVTIGNDDNAALVDPLALPSGQSTSSSFGEFQYYVSGPLSATRFWRLSGNAFVLKYADAGEFDQTLLDIIARYQREFDRWQLAAGPRLGQSYIAGDGFERTLGARIDLRRALPWSGAVVELNLAYDRSRELEAQYAYIQGERMGAGVSLEKTFGRTLVAVDYRRERDDRASSLVSADRTQLRSRFRRPFGTFWTGEMTVEYRDTEYASAAPVRNELRYRLGLLAVRRFASDFRLSARFWQTDNDATASPFSYSRSRFSLGLSWVF